MSKYKLTPTEKARTVASTCTSGTLCTIIPNAMETSDEVNKDLSNVSGAPWGSYVDYILDESGCPVLLVNEDSQHTKFFKNNNGDEGEEGMVSLFMQLGGKGGAQDVSRCTLTGRISPIPKTSQDLPSLRMRYSITHEYADRVLDSDKFCFWRVEPMSIYYVGGFGVMAKWVDVEEYSTSKSDILASSSSTIISSLNTDHSTDNLNVAHHVLGCENVESVRVTTIDRLGVDFRVTYGVGRKVMTDEFRIGFRVPILSVEDAKSECLKVYQEAWEIMEGISYGDEEDEEEGIPVFKFASDGLGRK